jgi:hypothetical protein
MKNAKKANPMLNSTGIRLFYAENNRFPTTNG